MTSRNFFLEDRQPPESVADRIVAIFRRYSPGRLDFLILLFVCLAAAAYFIGPRLSAVPSVQAGSTEIRWSELERVGYPQVAPAWTQEVSGTPVPNRVRIGLVIDYQCPYSQTYIRDILPRLLERPDVRVEVYDLPLPSHENAVRAAAAARCAAAQGRVAEFVGALIAYDPEVGKTDEIARLIGLNQIIYRACLPDAASASRRSALAVTEIGISGTPATIISGRVLNGTVDWEILSRLIDEARDQAKAESPTFPK